jgi:hypothetical protein
VNISGFVALGCIAFVAWAWHGITEHHALRRLLRVVRSSTQVPLISRFTPWHHAGHWKRMAAMVSMGALAYLIGFGWQLSPIVTGIALILASLPVVCVLAVRHSGDLAMRPNERIENIDHIEEGNPS